jgi:hypothetical protein
MGLQQQPQPGEINSDSLYTLAEVQARLRIGAHGMRQAKRQGLKIRRLGNRRLILGRDLVTFVETVEVEGQQAA